MPLRKKKSLIDQASDVVDATVPVIETAVATMREQVRDLAQDTRDKAAPLIADTKVLAGEIAEATREVAIPKAKVAALSGAERAAGRAADLASSGRDLAAAKAAEVEGSTQRSRGSKVRKVLIFGSIAAALGFVYNKMRSRAQADNWQSSYTPPSSSTSATTSSPTDRPTTSSTAAATGGTHLAPGVGPDQPVGVDDPMAARAAEQGMTDDAGGASPDEALADAAEEPHPVSTPDDPADVVEIEGQATKKK